MAGASLPYHLRPHKAVDRRIFIELLRRFERWRPVQEYAYFSMGAYPLEDHKLIHRALGITRLITFDYDHHVVARQEFNKPIETCRCLNRSSEQIIDELHSILTTLDCGDDCGVIAWLDYTSPKQIGSQLLEFQSLLDRLRIGDIVRVTVNAHTSELSDVNDRPIAGQRPPTLEQRQIKQFRTLQERIGDLMPSTATAGDLTMDGLPKLLALSFGAAALKALPASGDSTFLPLSITRYRDGQQMLSLTGVIAKRSEINQIRKSLDLEAWPFSSADWTEIHKLVVPDLTLRERLLLERQVTIKSPDEIVKMLGFESAGEIDLLEFLESYRKYYRFYPAILSADV